MSKQLLKNAGFNTASQLINMAVNILFVPAYIFFLGINGYGIYSFMILMFSWITILQAGIDPAVIRMTAKYAAENSHANISPLISASLLFQLAIASLTGMAFFMSSDYLASFIVKNETEFLIETKTALYYAAINIIILMCKNVYVSLFKGLQRYDISSIYETLFSILASVLSLVALWLGYGIVGMIIVRLAINILSIVLLHFIAKMLISAFHFSLNIPMILIKEIYNYASWIVIGRINRLAVNALPPIMIGMYIGPSGIAYFNISSKVVLALNNLLASSTNVIFPFISELKALKEKSKIASLYIDSNRLLSFISTPLFCFGAIYSWDILYTWIGLELADNCWLLMSLFFIGYYLSSSTMIPSYFALGIGNSRILALNGFAQTTIVILFLPYLLKYFGITGAGINLILFETASIVTGIIITTKLINASAFIFWIKDRLLLLLISTTIFLVFIPFKYLLWETSFTRIEMGAYLSLVFFVGVSFYVFIIKNSNLIDKRTKNQITKIFNKTGK